MINQSQTCYNLSYFGMTTKTGMNKSHICGNCYAGSHCSSNDNVYNNDDGSLTWLTQPRYTDDTSEKDSGCRSQRDLKHETTVVWVNVGIGACTFSHARVWCKTPSMMYVSIMFTCCLTRDWQWKIPPDAQLHTLERSYLVFRSTSARPTSTDRSDLPR